MRFGIIIAVALSLLVLAGCQAQDAAQQYNEPSVEAPSSGNDEITVNEQVIVPAHEPEPEPEAQAEPEVQQPMSVLDDYETSEHFLHGNPDVGQATANLPRKVEIVFNYPVTTGTNIEVWDEAEAERFDDGETVIAGTDLLVAITYLDNMFPGVYKVRYYAVLAGKDNTTESGYYYFELQ